MDSNLNTGKFFFTMKLIKQYIITFAICFIFVEDICRVCRCEGTADKPLYHPCICTGSIKYVHQEWSVIKHQLYIEQ